MSCFCLIKEKLDEHISQSHREMDYSCVSINYGTLGFKSVKADHNESIFFQTTAPILCASYDDMTKWLEHNDFEIVSVGIGRKGGVPDGEPVYMIQGYKKKDKDVFVSSVETPDGIDKCLMYNLFRMKYSSIVQL